MIWFTSDTHFGHANVLKFSERPWDDIDDMNYALIENINALSQLIQRSCVGNTSAKAALY